MLLVVSSLLFKIYFILFFPSHKNVKFYLCKNENENIIFNWNVNDKGISTFLSFLTRYTVFSTNSEKKFQVRCSLEGMNIARDYCSECTILWGQFSSFLPRINMKEQREIHSLMGEPAADRHGILKQLIEATDPLFPCNFFKLSILFKPPPLLTFYLPTAYDLLSSTMGK